MTQKETIEHNTTLDVVTKQDTTHFSATALVDNINKSDPQIGVGTASGELAYPLTSAQLDLPQVPSYFPKSGHVMLAFKHSLMGLGIICDTEFSVHFHKHTETIMTHRETHCSKCVWKKKGAKVWCFDLRPQNSTPSTTEEGRKAFNFVPCASVYS